MKQIHEILEELEKERIKEMKMKDIFQHCISWIESLKEYRVEGVGEKEADILQSKIDGVLEQLRSVAEHEAGYLNRTYKELRGFGKEGAHELEIIQDHFVKVASLMKDLKKDVDRTKGTLSKGILQEIHDLISRLSSIMADIILETGALEKELKSQGGG